MISLKMLPAVPPAVVDWLQLARAPAIFSAVSNILAAQLIVGRGQTDPGMLMSLVAISSCLYAAGMILNDCFDLREDRRERPSRPLPAGRIPTRNAWAVGWLLLLVANITSLAVGQLQFLIAIALTGLILLYNGVAKRSVAGPFVMGGCRYLNWILGLSTGGLAMSSWLLPIPVFLYIVALTVLSRGETGARAAGAVSAAAVGLVVALVFLLLPAYQSLLANVEVVVLLLMAGSWLVYRLLALRGHADSVAVQATVSLMIFGVIPLDAMLASAAGPWWAGFLVLLLLLPARALGRLLYVT
jgi:4-hydroxybenzoate polyprenyltransferase